MPSRASIFVSWLITASALAAPQSIPIQVVGGADRTPLGGATLEVIRAYNGQDKPTPTTYTADADGRFTIEVERDNLRALVVIARKSGFVATRVSWSTRGVASVLQVPTRITVPLPEASTIGGVVVDPEGNPLPDVQLWINARNYHGVWDNGQAVPNPQSRVTTDHEGRWAWPFMPKEDAGYALSIMVASSDPQQRPRDRLLEAPRSHLRNQTARLVLKMEPVDGSRLSGVVVSDTGVPVPEAEIRVSSSRTGMVANGTSAADGLFELQLPMRSSDPNRPSPREPSYFVSVRAPGHAGFAAPLPNPIDGAPMRIELEPSRTIQGRVVDPDGNPIAQVKVYTQHPLTTTLSLGRTTTDAEGRFTLTDIPAAGAKITLQHWRYQSPPEEVLPHPGERSLSMRLVPSVTGTVTDAESGAAIPRFNVKLTHPDRPHMHLSHPRYQTGGENGQYSFQVRQAEVYLRFEAEGYLPFVSDAIQRANAPLTLDVQLQRPRPAFGTVVDAQGVGVAGAVVAVLPREPRGFASFNLAWPLDRQPRRGATRLQRTETSASGAFTITSTEALGAAFVMHADGFAWIEADDVDWSQSTTESPIRFRLEPWATISGQVPLHNGKPLGKTVTYSTSGGIEGVPPLVWQCTAEVAADGRYQLGRVLPRGGTVSLDTLSGRLAWEHVEPQPRSHQEVDLGALGRRVVGILDLSESQNQDRTTRSVGPTLVQLSSRSVQAARIGFGAEIAETVPIDEVRTFDFDAYQAFNFGPYRRMIPEAIQRVAFVFPSIPPGSYRLTVRHPYGNATSEVDIPEDGTGAIDLGVIEVQRRRR